MIKLLFPIIICLIIIACTPIDTINFERMSEVELAQYNSGRPDGQKIVCTEDDRSFSRVRRRRCVTFEQMYGSAAQVDQLSILN